MKTNQRGTRIRLIPVSVVTSYECDHKWDEGRRIISLII